MQIKKTLTTSLLIVSVMMVATSAATQSVYAQLFGTDQIGPGETVHLSELIDGSGSISTVDPDGGGCNPPADLCSEWDLERNGVADGLDTLAAVAPELLGLLYISVIEFGTDATLRCSGEIVDVAAMTVLTDCIRTMDKDDLSTDVEAAILLASAEFDNNPRDHHIIDLVSDGNPTDSACGDTDMQCALDARDDSVTDHGLDQLASLGIAIANLQFLKDIVWEDPPGEVAPPFPDCPPDCDKGFVVEANTFDEFAAAFLSKLIVVVDIPFCEEFPDDPSCITEVGGEFLPIHSTSLLIAGMFANIGLIVPIAAGIAGVGVYLIRYRMNKD